MAKLEMDVINTHCAGIDIGSRSHFVAVWLTEWGERQP